MRRIIRRGYAAVCGFDKLLTTTLKERSWVICIVALVLLPVMGEELAPMVVLGVVVVCVLGLADQWQHRQDKQ